MLGGMTLRAYSAPWQIAAQHDRRRGLWYRTKVDIDHKVLTLEICAGREGDDDYVKIERGQVPDAVLDGLVACLQSAVWARELNNLPTNTEDL